MNNINLINTTCSFISSLVEHDMIVFSQVIQYCYHTTQDNIHFKSLLLTTYNNCCDNNTNSNLEAVTEKFKHNILQAHASTESDIDFLTRVNTNDIPLVILRRSKLAFMHSFTTVISVPIDLMHAHVIQEIGCKTFFGGINYVHHGDQNMKNTIIKNFNEIKKYLVVPHLDTPHFYIQDSAENIVCGVLIMITVDPLVPADCPLEEADKYLSPLKLITNEPNHNTDYLELIYTTQIMHNIQTTITSNSGESLSIGEPEITIYGIPVTQTPTYFETDIADLHRCCIQDCPQTTCFKCRHHLCMLPSCCNVTQRVTSLTSTSTIPSYPYLFCNIHHVYAYNECAQEGCKYLTRIGDLFCLKHTCIISSSDTDWDEHKIELQYDDQDVAENMTLCLWTCPMCTTPTGSRLINFNSCPYCDQNFIVPNEYTITLKSPHLYPYQLQQDENIPPAIPIEIVPLTLATIIDTKTVTMGDEVADEIIEFVDISSTIPIVKYDQLQTVCNVIHTNIGDTMKKKGGATSPKIWVISFDTPLDDIQDEPISTIVLLIQNVTYSVVVKIKIPQILYNDTNSHAPIYIYHLFYSLLCNETHLNELTLGCTNDIKTVLPLYTILQSEKRIFINNNALTNRMTYTALCKRLYYMITCFNNGLTKENIHISLYDVKPSTQGRKCLMFQCDVQEAYNNKHGNPDNALISRAPDAGFGHPLCCVTDIPQHQPIPQHIQRMIQAPDRQKSEFSKLTLFGQFIVIIH